MKLHSLVVLLAVVLAFASCEKKRVNYALLKGQVLTEDAKSIAVRGIRTNSFNSGAETFEAKLEGEKQFELKIPVDQVRLGRIHIGNFWHEIALEPGDEMTIKVNGDTIKYTGKGAGKNELLYAMEKKGLWERSYYIPEFRKRVTPDEFLIKLDEFRAKRLDLFNETCKTNNVSESFKTYFKEADLLSYNGVLVSYAGYYPRAKKIPADSVKFPYAYSKAMILKGNLDDNYLKYANYLGNVESLMRIGMRKQLVNIKTQEEYQKLQLSFIKDSLQGLTRNYFIANKLANGLKFGNKDSLLHAYFNTLNADSICTKLVATALAKLEAKEQLLNRPLNEAFAKAAMRDTSGKAISFGEMIAQHKGHVVYVDFWGMGCGPCRAAMPYAKKLKEQLKNEPIDFVYISVSKIPQEQWKRAFEMTHTDKNHFVFKNGFGNSLYKFMDINWVPCYMIFDKEGHLVNYQADRPSKSVEGDQCKLRDDLIALAKKS